MAWLLTASNTASLAEENVCGAVPELSSLGETNENIKGELAGQANLLSKYVGKGDLSGKIEAFRKSLYQSSPEYFAAQKDTYSAYIFCTIIMKDNSLSTREKVDLLLNFKKPAPRSDNNESDKSSDKPQKRYTSQGLTVYAISSKTSNNVVNAKIDLRNDLNVGQFVSFCALVASGSASLNGSTLQIDTSKISGLPSHYSSDMTGCLRITNLDDMTYMAPSAKASVSLTFYGSDDLNISRSTKVVFPVHFAVRTEIDNGSDATSGERPTGRIHNVTMQLETVAQ